MKTFAGSASLVGILLLFAWYQPVDLSGGIISAQSSVTPQPPDDGHRIRSERDALRDESAGARPERTLQLVTASTETRGPEEPAVPVGPTAGARTYSSPIAVDRVRPGVCGGWSEWPAVSTPGRETTRIAGIAAAPGMAPGPDRQAAAQTLWSSTLVVGRSERTQDDSGFSILEGLGALSASGFRLDRSNFAVLTALQMDDGFLLELASVDDLPGGFMLHVDASRGRDASRLSSCDSIQSTGTFGSRFLWSDARVNWRTGEAVRIAILRTNAEGRMSEDGRSSRRTVAPGRFEDVPDHHAGRDFELTLRMLDHAGGDQDAIAQRLRITAGAVTDLKRRSPDDGRWQLKIRPDGRQAVAIRLLADSGCTGVEADCDAAAGASAAPLEVVIPGPAISVRALNVPDYHSGLSRVPMQIEFSEPLSTSLRALLHQALDTNGTPLEGVRRVDGRPELVDVIVTPNSGDPVKIMIDPEQACSGRPGHCLDDLQRLTAPLELTIPAATVHLTFDDGPHPVYTPQILDILAYHGARATFFVTGVAAGAYPELIERIVGEGHTLANHTWNHDTLAGMSQAEFDATVTRTQAMLGEHATACLRPPNYTIDEHTAGRAAKLGLRLIMGTVRTRDWMRPGADVIAERIFAGAEPNAVIVLHDGGGDRSQTVEGLRNAMWDLRTLNYSFEPICSPRQPLSPGGDPGGKWLAEPSVPPLAFGF